MRRSYLRSQLDIGDLAPTWWGQFQAWFATAAADPQVVEANAMQLATADASGRPAVRTVLCRGFGADGLTFFTNYDSAKGRDLAANPQAAAVFSWLPLERQVRLAGPVGPVSRAETVAYAATRPPASVVASWASPQSQVIADREVLAAGMLEFADRREPPPGWGGYRLRPDVVEFWQGRPNRLHDRLRYRRKGPAEWVVERLAP